MTNHHHQERKPLAFFASPLHEEEEDPRHGIGALKGQQRNAPASEDLIIRDGHANETVVPLNKTDRALLDLPAFRRHAESTNSELFFDLFFVANLSTFTSLSEINDAVTLTAYVGFFAVLWLTWCNVSLFDVRFIADSVFERIAKAFHFGVMVGFAVVGPSWQPGKGYNFKAYRALSMILMGSRIVLALQYAVTLYFTRKQRRMIVPMSLMIALMLLAAIMYGALMAGFTHPGCARSDWITGTCVPPKSDVYVAWYVIGILELVATIAISSKWRIISFKGTHIEQRMSLLTLIVLGEGVMVICKAISRIVKVGYVFDGPLIGQIVASVLIIYFLYMLYFDRMQNEHFGTIRQQAWSLIHFPLHVSLVLVLQGVSLLIDWVVAVQGLEATDLLFQRVEEMRLANIFLNGTEYVQELRHAIDEQVWTRIPKGVDASKALELWNKTLAALGPVHDYLRADPGNNTALYDITNHLSTAETISIQTIFDSLSISVAKEDKSSKSLKFEKMDLLHKYEKRFVLVFDYVYISAGIALMVMATIGIISLPASRRHMSEYLRLGVNAVCGLALCLITLVNTSAVTQERYMESAWMLPVICIITFLDVVAIHTRKPRRQTTNKIIN